MEKVLFSPGFECLDAIIEEINNAKKNIKICVFTISDNRIVEVLKNKLKEGIKIKIISDNDKRLDRGSDVGYLSSLLPVKVDLTKAHMHHKFAIIDDKIILTGSYNWTRSAQKYNYENVLITDNKNIVKEFITEFDILWDKMKSINTIQKA